ncbi:hypothetical protein FSS13T_15750 [Flavobacterium saliperosum S13]|uniref:GYF domain-containing protein n=2 Tax=Flavobacterium saliperosum TaxID=329186 RepID=A0A1G4VGK2_9FLAO|nr:DUF4339 domain-containing protein [Flavobacterium saliperosum]ESU25623.1 hypothetical protein FSS13T_15750 [Flavobacterium saliperosum S13]SCX06516.1 protein of unknown function [Flavobacterium saliperosum]
MKKYYLHNGTENIGPFDLDELKAKGITKSTQVWCEGMENWKEAGNIDELKSIMLVIPPPISKIAESKPVAPIIKKKTNWIGRIMTLAGVALVIIIGLTSVSAYLDNQQNTPPVEAFMTAEDMEAAYPLNYLSAGGEYKENFLGDKIKIKGFIRNSASVTTYKDVVVEVVFYSKTGSEINTEKYTLYEFYSPSTQKEFELKVTNYRNVAEIGWRVVGSVVK